MFLITNQFGAPYYVTGVEEVAQKYCAEENAKQNLHRSGVVAVVSYKEVAALGAMNVNCHDLNPLIETVPSCELDAAWSPTITPEQKQSILNTLGFTGRGKGLWYHKTLGEDTPENRFHFNLGDGDLSKLPRKMFLAGYENLRNQFKTVFSEV